MAQRKALLFSRYQLPAPSQDKTTHNISHNPFTLRGRGIDTTCENTRPAWQDRPTRRIVCDIVRQRISPQVDISVSSPSNGNPDGVTIVLPEWKSAGHRDQCRGLLFDERRVAVDWRDETASVPTLVPGRKTASPALRRVPPAQFNHGIMQPDPGPDSNHSGVMFGQCAQNFASCRLRASLSRVNSTAGSSTR